jgi:transcriptional regulator with XRE-family HTH domain
MANTELSKRVKELRLKRGLSQDQLADISGLSLRTVQRVESGQNIPRGDTLSRLAIALQVSTEEIVELQSIENGHDHPTVKSFWHFFDDWKLPIFFFLLSICIFVIGLVFKSNIIMLICSLIFVIGFLMLTFSIIYQFSKRRWMAGILTSIIVFISLFGFIGYFTLDTKHTEVVHTTTFQK